ncbi:kinase binding protein CGI-121-domain-containing protein [Xylaria sp. FL0043]|nr:kinase binding protein CGI-121-domain-containing protein [Xylaria sp. FL0043]
MGPDIQNSYESDNINNSKSPETGSRLTSSAKRQKTEHQTHPATDQHSTMSTPSILETFQLEHIPPTHSVHVAVFRDVENAAFLHQQLLARNADFEYALIDAGVITSRLQVLSAAFKAITAQVAGTMKTPNVHSEMVYALSPASNIAEAYRRHGITPTSRSLVIVKVLVTPQSSVTEPTTTTTSAETAGIADAKAPRTAQDVEKHLITHVQGKPLPFTDETLSELTDWGRVRKYYKLNGMGWLDGIKDSAAKNREMDMLVMSGMALRGV